MSDKKILVVDDTISNLDILSDLLEDYDVIDVTNGADALEIVNEESIDLILLDIMMPDMDGYEVCTRLKANDETKNIPIVFITAKVDEESIEKAYDLGGADYVTKPFKPKELLARVKKELKIQELIKSLELKQEELKLLASTDPMTDLYNRRYFSKVSKNILGLAKRDKKELSIIMMDIDKFKNINDTYGHQVGDDVIVALANILKEKRRNSDIVCRFGGEEFIILLPNTSINGASILAEKIRVTIENSLINKSISVTSSFGISSVHLDDDIETSIVKADKALYNAKESGRNRICISV